MFFTTGRQRLLYSAFYNALYTYFMRSQYFHVENIYT